VTSQHSTRAAHSEHIHASKQDCLDALLDFGSYPGWQSAVKAIDVREGFPDGGALVAFEIDDGTVTATYRVGIDPGRFVPGPIKRALTEGVMKRSVRELKARVEGTS